MNNKGIILVVSGPAGSGKGTVVSILKELMPDTGLSVSATTRQPRPGEIDGVSYHFITKDEFEKLIAEGGVLEHTSYCGNYYGTLKSEAEKILGEGRDLILEIEVEGALQVKRLMPEETVTVMLIAPSRAEQEKRLRERGTEDDEVIEKRLRRAAEEMALAGQYDYVVTNENGRIEDCADKLRSIIRAEHSRYSRMRSVIDGYDR